ncbi:Crp/Fnr family transcriptional regulator [Actinoplanes sp. NPDC051861]|uniref:Crp/Fnr family transcriptional regulator n=1 Tax=Actinoplanes sp. NPDC051861 TaxID=3155170 RepID=UPI00343C8C58
MNESESWPPESFVGRLPARERSDLFRAGRQEAWRNGGYLVRQGVPGQDVFVVLSGRVRIMVSGLRGDEYQVGSCGRGELIGEVSYLDQRPRSASAYAYRGTTLLHLAGEAFGRFLDGHPLAYRALARSLTERLRASEKRFVTASADVEGRVAATLCYYLNTMEPGAQGTGRVWCTQGSLAEQIGASTASVHRILRKFAGLGYLETEHRSILVKDLAALAEIAGSKSIYIK